MMLTGDAACSLSPDHARIQSIVQDDAALEPGPFRYRRIGAAREPA
ncbi:hypothetical protein [Aureimonas ureilytica]|nr:hypothetical protein [Aureimonas ureilytica]